VRRRVAESERTGSAVTGRFQTLVAGKTGQPPSVKQIQSGIIPQIALELAIALESGFSNVTASELTHPAVVRLAGGVDSTYETILVFKDASPADVAADSISRLKKLIDAFENPHTPYLSLLHPMFKTRRYGDFDHLARVREWSLAAEDGGGEE